MSTIFTKIINREVPSKIIYEDDIVIAFLDISQATPGHSLVVTKKEYRNIFELPEEVASHIFKIVVRISKAINFSLKPKGINILNNNEETAGQTVFHYHIHLIPRYDSGDVLFGMNNNFGKVSDEELEKRVNLIRSAL